MAIEFVSIEWSNFLSTGNTPNKIILNDASTTLIVGKNGDGKSTFLDALTFALFGKPFRNINKNQLINSINNKNCKVAVNFIIGKKEYTVIRGIKPGIFEIWCNKKLLNQNAATKDYQKVLEQQILRLNYKTFTQVIILGSASFIPFMQLSPSQRRDVIEDILDIRIFSTMNQILKEHALNTKDSIQNIDADIKVAKGNTTAQSSIIKMLTESKSANKNTLLNKIKQNNELILENEDLNEKLTNKILINKDKISTKSSLIEEIEKLREETNDLTFKQNLYSKDIEFFTNKDDCPSCKQGIEEGHKHTIISDLFAKIEDIVLELKTIKLMSNKLVEKLEEFNVISELIFTDNTELTSNKNSIIFLQKQIGMLNEEIEDLENDTLNLDNEKSKLKDMAEEAMSKINKKQLLLEERNLQEVSSLLLKDTGIKTAIIREYLPAMNKLINKYLNSMDTYIHFELDESFNEIIKSRYRDEFTYESFSEGEKQKIDISLLFSWRYIAQMKNSVNTNLLIMDEIFDSSLDSGGTDLLMQVLNGLPKNTNIFVISHKTDQLLDKFANVIRFEKRNEFSVIC